MHDSVKGLLPTNSSCSFSARISGTTHCHVEEAVKGGFPGIAWHFVPWLLASVLAAAVRAAEDFSCVSMDGFEDPSA